MQEQPRDHIRIKEYLKVHWSAQGQSGEATALDISASGLKIIMDKLFRAPEDTVFTVAMQLGKKLSFGPKKARVAWSKRVSRRGTLVSQFGLEFIDKGPGFDRELKEWLEEKVAAFAQATDTKILTHYLF